MKNQSTLNHLGVVSKIENDIIFIDIEVKSACSECHANNYCSAFGKKDKIIEVSSLIYPNINVGETVNVIIKESLGIQALIFAYFIPVIVLLLALFISYQTTKNEGISALITLSFVALYYFVLWLLREKFKKHFYFEIEKV